MEKVIIGAGGFAKEVKSQMNNSNIKMFVNDEYWISNDENIFKLSDLNIKKHMVIVAIGNPIDRYKIIKKLPLETMFYNFIHHSTLFLSNDIEIGIGSIICAGCILTTNIKIGNHSQLNLHTTIGHDTVVGDFFTTAPGVKISGNCTIGDRVYFGTNSSVKEKIKICDDVVIGLNSGVVKNIELCGVYGGVPINKIK